MYTSVLHVGSVVAVAIVVLGFVVEGEGEVPGDVPVGMHNLLGTRNELAGTWLHRYAVLGWRVDPEGN